MKPLPHRPDEHDPVTTNSGALGNRILLGIPILSTTKAGIFNCPIGTLRLTLMLLTTGGALHAEEPVQTMPDVVSYEAFGAAGDGVTDDLPAICAAHAYANEHDLPVRSNPTATYHLGRRALKAIIQTDTDWNTSRFIIDDSQGVENHKEALFEVRSRLEPIELEIERLERGQAHLDLNPPQDCLVRVTCDKRRIYIRRGLNQNNGREQTEVFILRRDGSIEGGIDWDYDEVTQVEARPIDASPLILRGGFFIQIANQMRQEVGYNYWSRGISITRSNTTVDGLSYQVAGETNVGHPYQGFLNASVCANISFLNCKVEGHKTYSTIGNAGKPVPMGTYGYLGSFIVNLGLINCRMSTLHDRSRWGVMATNFIKNLLVEDCTLSRVDSHMGVSGNYIIRRSTIGHAGINVIGRGHLLIEESTIHTDHLVSFRTDYGSTWDGDVIVRNCRWIIPEDADAAVMFTMKNDGTHDFGYPCSMPQSISIDGLLVDDLLLQEDAQGFTYFSDPIGPPVDHRPFPYRLTERLEVRGLTIASGREPRVSDNPEVASSIRVIVAD